MEVFFDKKKVTEVVSLFHVVKLKECERCPFFLLLFKSIKASRSLTKDFFMTLQIIDCDQRYSS